MQVKNRPVASPYHDKTLLPHSLPPYRQCPQDAQGLFCTEQMHDLEHASIHHHTYRSGDAVQKTLRDPWCQAQIDEFKSKRDGNISHREMENLNALPLFDLEIDASFSQNDRESPQCLACGTFFPACLFVCDRCLPSSK